MKDHVNRGCPGDGEVSEDERSKNYLITMLGGIVMRKRRGDSEIALRFVRMMGEIFDFGTALIFCLLLVLIGVADWSLFSRDAEKPDAMNISATKNYVEPWLAGRRVRWEHRQFPQGARNEK